jgi:hypothetical protein
LKVSDTVRAERRLTVNVTGEITSKLETQGIVFHRKMFKRLPSDQGGLNMTKEEIATSSNPKSAQGGTLRKKKYSKTSKAMRRQSRSCHLRRRRVSQSMASIESQAMAAPDLVESRRSEANTTINTRDEDGSVSGDTEPISTPELDDITLGGTVEEAKMVLAVEEPGDMRLT